MKVLILYAKYGGGHLAAANSIKNYIESNYENTEVMSVDFVEYFNNFLNNSTTNAYKLMAKKAPIVWKKLYYGSTKGFLSDVSNFADTLMAIKLKKLINEFQPDLIISTHPFGTPIIAHLKKNNVTNAKFAVIFTDFAPHAQWLFGKEFCDYFFVSNDNMKTELINSYNVPEQLIHVTGIPLSSAFSGPFNNDEIYTKYDLDKNKKLILFFGGGEFGLGQKRTVQILKSLTRYTSNYQILAVSGRNAEMYNAFLELSKQIEGNDLHVVEYTTDVPGLMHLSSLVVTKPGGLTSSESLASELPILITTPIPGQEEENAEFLVNSGAGVLLGKNDDIDETVDKVLSDENKFAEMKENARKIAKKNSTRDICGILLGEEG